MKPDIEIDELEVNEYYWITIVCRNCGFDKSVAIKKGFTVDECVCPICECRTIKSK